jgi:hypothetical protein
MFIIYTHAVGGITGSYYFIAIYSTSPHMVNPYVSDRIHFNTDNRMNLRALSINTVRPVRMVKLLNETPNIWALDLSDRKF